MQYGDLEVTIHKKNKRKYAITKNLERVFKMQDSNCKSRQKELDEL